MNDRYLFRAKRIDTGEWYIGNLVDCPDGRNVIAEVGGNWALHEVDPSTICQCTGLKDKNGNKIWENDVCYYDDMDVCVVRFGEYDNNTGHKHVGFYTAWRKYKYMFRSDIGFWVKERELEVIGNIFDNPELLEGR